MRKGFTLLELLAVLGLIGALAVLSFPAWRTLMNSAARRTGEARIMESLEHARGEAISSGKEVWLLLRHDRGNGRDADRILARNGRDITPLGPWDHLPQGITFHEGSGGIPDAPPPRDILESAVNPGHADGSFGAVMFLRSGSIGWPKTGQCNLSIAVDSKNGTSVITLSRGTGRASISPAQGGTR